MNEYMPLLREIFQAAPVTVVVMIVVSLGFWAGRSSHNHHIETLKEWITYLRDGSRIPSVQAELDHLKKSGYTDKPPSQYQHIEKE